MHDKDDFVRLPLFRIDQIEDELIHEKLKIKAISDDLDGTFRQMTSI
jgi:hypothetical protein